MRIFSYKIEHDLGLAPNPFGGFCTLAVCKPQIRKNKNLKLGDWVVGTGSNKLGKLHKLIFAMKVEEKLTFEEYWDDPRFLYKRPVINGSLVQMYGDNIYHRDAKTNVWVQEDSAHSLESGRENAKHKSTDLGGRFVLVSQHFYYFGKKAIQIPKELLEVCSNGRNSKIDAIPVGIRSQFVAWIESAASKGIHGDPIGWDSHQEILPGLGL